MLLAVAATVLAGSWLAGRLGLPAPLVLIVIGIAGSYLPFVPEVALSPELVLYGLLPPLLYAAAISTSLVDFRTNRAAILSLSIGLVLFTALGVGIFLSTLLHIKFAVAFALGAVVGPPDAVAATAVGRAIGLPRRLTTILEGESLLNDATALVSLRTALAVAGLSGAAASHVTVGAVALDFGWALVGGGAIGYLLARVVEVVRRKLSSDPTFDTVISFMIPFAAYVPAEQVGSSGVIAVVTAGLVLGHRSPRYQPGASRLSERINWSSIQFLLENSVFLLIGLQVFYVIDRVRSSSQVGVGTIVLAAGGTLVLVLVLRPLWIFPYGWFRTTVLRKESKKPWTHQAVVSWAGMRGVVTLAAALLLPLNTDMRDVLVLIAVIVTVGTLLIQGTTLPWLARRLGVHGPDAREDALQAASIMQLASRAGLERLEHLAHVEGLDDATVELLRTRSADRVNQMWERLGPNEGGNETPSDQYRRGRLAMLDAEREVVLKVRDEGRAEHEVLRVVLNALDVEEMVLERIEYEAKRLGEDDLLPSETVEEACEHLSAAPASVPPNTPDGCEGCLREGLSWVHLRLCLTCGHVGCCDSSEGLHAQKHYDETRHPVMRSFEAGEAWRWCYVDEVLG